MSGKRGERDVTVGNVGGCGGNRARRPEKCCRGNSSGARYRDPLLAVEGKVPENPVRQPEALPSRFASRAGTRKRNGTCVGDSETTENDSYRRNGPEERRDQDQKAFGLVSVLEPQ